jgi:hypothetical protein
MRIINEQHYKLFYTCVHALHLCAAIVMTLAASQRVCSKQTAHTYTVRIKHTHTHTNAHVSTLITQYQNL